MSEIEFVDLSNEIDPIMYQGGRSAKNGREYVERTKEVNQIWKFKAFYCEGGAVIPDKEFRIGEDYRCCAEIRIAEGGNGLWAMAIGYSLPNQGSSSPISAFERIGFKDKDDARMAGIIKLQNSLERVANSQYCENSDKKMALELIELLEQQKRPQLDLF